MRILFIGAVKFSAKALEMLISIQAEIVGVCTLKESKFNSDHEDLTNIAHHAGIPVKYTPNINCDKSIDWIRKLKPDVIFCLGWSRILHPTLLNLPPLGVIGYHPTSLPANRGRHPLIWALILGLKETSSSFFFMDKGADTGDLLSQVSVTIYPNDDAGSLYKRITDTALKQLHYFLPKLARGEFERIPQDHQIANTWRKRSVKDGCIDWRMAAESIHNLVRGLARPYSGAHFNYSDQEIKVWKTEVEPSAPLNLEPGKVLEICESSLLIKTGIGAIRLLDYYPKIEFKLGEYI